MRRTAECVIFFALSWSAFAQAPQPPVSPDRPSAQQLTPQVLGEMLRTATTFHELVEKINPTASIGADQHVLGTDGRYHHPVARTAEMIGAGAGAGAAIGEMTHSPNGILIGAIIGSAGGLIVDQVMRHREEVREKANSAPAVDNAPEPRPLQRRDPRDEPMR